MSNGNVGVDVLIEEIDSAIESSTKATSEKQPTPLCNIHNTSIITLLRCEKYRLIRSRKVIKWGAIGSIIGGGLAAILYVAERIY
jgi:hypothetical protein